MTATNQPSETTLPGRDQSLLRDRFTIVWVLLVAATVVSFWVGTEHGISSDTDRALIVLIIAFVKVRYVGLYFMDLRAAPPVLRGMFEAYCVGVCLAMMAVYLIA